MRRADDPASVSCEECGVEATGRAWGWEAVLVDLDDDGYEDAVLLLCPDCAQRDRPVTRRRAIDDPAPTDRRDTP